MMLKETLCNSEKNGIFEYLYIVDIVNINDVIYCELTEYTHFTVASVVEPRSTIGEFLETNSKPFDLYTDLGDFINTYHTTDEHEYQCKSKQHPFFLNYDIDNKDPTDEDVDNGYPYPRKPKYLWMGKGRLNCITVPYEVMKIIRDNNPLTVDIIENARIFYELDFKHTIYYNSKRDRDYKYNAYIRSNPDDVASAKFHSEYPSTPWTMGVTGAFNSCMNLEKLFVENGNKNYRYSYSCHTIADIAFSVLHFLILHGYKLAECEHCGRFFATNTLKNKYCSRYSTFPGYSKYDCYTAKERLVQNQRRRKQSIYDNLYVKCGSEEESVVTWEFLDRCRDHKAAIKKRASVEHFQAYQEYLDSDILPKRWAR